MATVTVGGKSVGGLRCLEFPLPLLSPGHNRPAERPLLPAAHALVLIEDAFDVDSRALLAQAGADVLQLARLPHKSLVNRSILAYA